MIGVDFPITGVRTDQTRIITDGKIPIIENLAKLTELPRYGFRFNVVPLEESAGAIYAVHAFAELTS